VSSEAILRSLSEKSNFFAASEGSPNAYDSFGEFKGKWKLFANNTFMEIDASTGKPSKSVYVKWAKVGVRWMVVELEEEKLRSGHSVKNQSQDSASD